MTVDWTRRSNDATVAVENFIEGCRLSNIGEITNDKYSPRDGRTLWRSRKGDGGHVTAAVESAANAFNDGRWSRLSVARRRDILLRLAALIDDRIEELALLESRDVGKPINDALSFDVPAASATLRYCAEAADKLHGLVYGSDSASLSYQLQRPVGVVAGLVGWNFPLLLAITKLAPALAMGNSFVLKPSELTPLSALRLAELAIEAGVPPGVFNVIQGDSSIGAALAQHSRVEMLTFTGSTDVGKRLLVASGMSNMKRVLLECGGKAANIVFDDCPPLEEVASTILQRAFWNQGQVCVASSRLLVQEAMKDELLGLLTDYARFWTPSDPLDTQCRCGPVISRAHQKKVMGYIDAGLSQGAKIVFSSSFVPPFEDGFYVPPTIFADVLPDQKIAQEEIFGPVLSVMSFRDEADAIKLANGTIYGLSAIVWTKNLGRAHRVSQSLDSGWTIVNATATPAEGPADGVLSVGGQKQSGIGVEGGLEGLGAYARKTCVQFFV